MTKKEAIKLINLECVKCCSLMSAKDQTLIRSFASMLEFDFMKAFEEEQR